MDTSCINITSACRDVDLLNIISILKTILNILWVGTFVALVIWMMLDIVKAVASGEVDTKKLFGNLSRRLIAAIITILVPIIVHFAVSLLGNSGTMYMDCYSCANKENIDELAIQIAKEKINKVSTSLNGNHYQEAKKAVNKIKDDYYREKLMGDLEYYYDYIYNKKTGSVPEYKITNSTPTPGGNHNPNITED